MTKLLAIFIITLTVSCSSSHYRQNIAREVQTEEARSLNEIRSHAMSLLENHPELDKKSKNELSMHLNMAIDHHQKLKEKESKIFQLLLEKSFHYNKLTWQEKKEKEILKRKLMSVYDEKASNVLGLVSKIVEMSSENKVNNQLKDEMMFFIRDFR